MTVKVGQFLDFDRPPISFGGNSATLVHIYICFSNYYLSRSVAQAQGINCSLLILSSGIREHTSARPTRARGLPDQRVSAVMSLPISPKQPRAQLCYGK